MTPLFFILCARSGGLGPRFGPDTAETVPTERLLGAVREKHQSQHQPKKRYGSVVVRDYQFANHVAGYIARSGQTANKMTYPYIRILFVEATAGAAATPGPIKA